MSRKVFISFVQLSQAKFIMKIILSIAAFTLIFCSIVCNQITKAKNELTSMNTSSPDSETNADFTLEFQTEPASVKANEAVTLVFKVKNAKGEIVKDLPVVHEKPMHLLVVSEDLNEFYHIHPEPQTDGTYQVKNTFPNGGNYRLYADFTPKDSPQVVEKLTVKVEGKEREKVALVVDPKLEKTMEGLRVEMKPDAEIIAGKELMLDFNVFDAKTNKPATNLQKYLGEYAHFVIISEDLKQFVHAHPMSKEAKMEKQDESKPHTHDEQSKNQKNVKSPSTISAHTSFPTAGIYKVWGQFQRNGKVISVPFIVNVKAADQKAEVKAANVPADAIKVTLSKSGYEPAEIKIEKGKPIKLAFYRSDAENCGGEVVFAKLNIRKKLPVGETVLVEFTPTDAGEISFTCGMGMYKGKILVQ